MEGKRVIPKPLKMILEWDVAMTEKFVKLVDQNYGPLAKHKGRLRGLEYSCHGIPWLIGTATFIFLIPDNFVRQLLVNIFIALILDIIVVAIIKAITRRRRPLANKGNEMFGAVLADKYSFPSGHATRAVMLSIMLPLQFDLLVATSFVLIVWGGAVCVSRVLLQRHHILDVVGGAIIGVLQALFMSQIWLSPESAQGFVNFFLDETQAGASFDV